MLKLAALLAIGMLLSVSIITALESVQYADAIKATKADKQRHKISKWMGNSVCGDELCEGHSYFKWNFKARTYKSPYDTFTHQELLKIKGQ